MMSNSIIADLEMACDNVRNNPAVIMTNADWIIRAHKSLRGSEFWGIVRKYPGVEQAILRANIL